MVLKVALWVFAMAGIVVLQALVFLMDGWALRLLWGWFFVPILGLPALSLSEAIGIGIVGGFITNQYIDAGKAGTPESWDRTKRSVIHKCVVPPITVLSGWVVHQFTSGAW